MPGPLNPTPPVQTEWKQGKNNPDEMIRKFGITINNLLKGKHNAAGRSFTCATSAATTVVTDDIVGPQSHITVQATTAAAAAELATLYIVPGIGSFTVNHTNSATTGRTFSYSVQG